METIGTRDHAGEVQYSLVKDALNGDSAPEADLEITPEMIEAGIAPLMQSGRVSENLPDWVARSIVGDILRAALQMARCEQTRSHP
jgi:hypothetical protein